MAVLPVILHPDPVLRKKTEAVASVTDDIRNLLDDMLDTMYAHDGIGLAAPQVNQSLRVIVMDVEERDEKTGRGNPLCMVNPEIIARGEEKVIMEEGCLSLPSMRVEVLRPEQVTVRYLDRDGQECEMQADGLLAKCIQHEIDHLNGVLIFDYLSSLKRDMALRRYQKYLRQLQDNQAG